jgi:integrase
VGRDYGSGSITEVRDGVWRLRVRAGVDTFTGKPRIITETFHGKPKAAQQRLSMLVAQHAGRRTSSTITLGQLLDQWSTASQILASSKLRYEYALKHLPERWYQMRADTLTRRDLELLYADLTAQGVGAATIRKLHNALSAAYTAAVRWDLLTVNPCRGARAPQTRSVPDTVPGLDVLRAVLEAANDDDEQTVVWITLAIVTGARRGEVLAVRWRDVDLVKKVVSLNGSINDERQRASTKTRRTRLVPIDSHTAQLLERWRRSQAERALAVGLKISQNCYVLSSDLGSREPWVPHAISQKFRRLRMKAGVDIRLHDLRHAYASHLLGEGVPLPEVSALLGHTKTSTTANIYAHVVERKGPSAAEIMRRAMG